MGRGLGRVRHSPTRRPPPPTTLLCPSLSLSIPPLDRVWEAANVTETWLGPVLGLGSPAGPGRGATGQGHSAQAQPWFWPPLLRPPNAKLPREASRVQQGLFLLVSLSELDGKKSLGRVTKLRVR